MREMTNKKMERKRKERKTKPRVRKGKGGHDAETTLRGKSHA
jgi:hypothetical protein